MKKIIIIFILFFICFNLFCKNKEDIIEEIRKNYAEVEKNIKNFKKMTGVYFSGEEPPKQYETYYNDKNEIVKLIEITGDSTEEEAFSTKTIYYFNNGKLFFIFKIVSLYDLTLDKTVNEVHYRIYFNKNKIIDALIKKADDGDISNKKNAPYEEVLNDINGYSKMYLKEAETAIADFLKSNPQE